MKMTDRHFQWLKKVIGEALEVRQIKIADFKAQYQAQGLSDMRFRWDLWYLVPQLMRNDLCSALYSYLDDTHIDTALKRVVKELEGK